MDQSFFAEAREQSQIKARIVAKYFWAWAKVLVGAGAAKIAYVDLFAGPGRYDDETPSTPILVLQRAVDDRQLRERLVTIFNDKSVEFAESLRTCVSDLPGIDQLRFSPRVETEEVGQNIITKIRETGDIPTFLFADPWGYKGLSLSLISSVLQSWGSDCVFFFNYNRISPALSNELVHEHMNDLFGENRAKALRAKIVGLEPSAREKIIIHELSEALDEFGLRYVLPFRFSNDQTARTSHHLIFASRKFRGYEIMKEIMAGESTNRDQGVASFSFSRGREEGQFVLEFLKPFNELQERLLVEFAGKTLTMRQIYEAHSPGTPYIRANYKKALVALEARGKVTAAPTASMRPKRNGEPTFGDDVIVTFPRGDKS